MVKGLWRKVIVSKFGTDPLGWYTAAVLSSFMGEAFESSSH